MPRSRVLVGVAVVLVAVVAAVSLLVAHGGVGSSASSAPCVSLGIEYNTHATAAWIALHDHLFRRFGLRVCRVVVFRTGLELAAALSRGEVDVAWACIAPVFKMVANRGIRVVVVAGAHFYGYGCVGRPGVDSVWDLVRLGRPRVAVTGPGTPVHLLLLAAEERWHFNATVVYAKPPAILALVEKGAVDAACLPEPLLSVAAARGLRILFTAQQVWPYMPGSYLVALRGFAERHPDVICRLWRLERYATEEIYRNMTRAAVIDSEYLHLPLGVVEASLHRMLFTWRVNVTALQQMADFMYEHHLLRRRLNVSELVFPVERLCGGG